MKQDPTFKKSYWLLCATMTVFLAGRLIQGDLWQGDAESYLDVARLLKSGAYFIPATGEDAALLTVRPFLYPVLLLFPGFCNAVVILLLQTALGFFNIYLVLRLFRVLGGSGGKTITACILLTPSIFIYTHLIMTEACVMALVLWLALLLCSGLSPKKIALIQLILVLLVFLKPVFYLFTVVNIAFFAIYFVRNRQMHLVVLLPFLLVIAYMGFNRYRTGYFHFSSIQNVNLVDYNLNLFVIKKHGGDSASRWRHGVYARAALGNSFEEKQQILHTEAQQVIRENLVSYAVFHFYGAMRGMVDPGRADLALFVKENDPKDGFLFKISSLGYWGAVKDFLRPGRLWQVLVLVPVFLVCLLKWFFVFVRLWQKKKMIDFAAAYLILFSGYYILITGPVNASRYMMPLQGLLIAVAVTGWQNFRKSKEEHLPPA